MTVGTVTPADVYTALDLICFLDNGNAFPLIIFYRLQTQCLALTGEYTLAIGRPLRSEVWYFSNIFLRMLG